MDFLSVVTHRYKTFPHLNPWMWRNGVYGQNYRHTGKYVTLSIQYILSIIYYFCISLCRFDPTMNPSHDPHTNTDTCNVCYILNHEWLKHGTCFSSLDNEDFFMTNAQEYFVGMYVCRG